MKGHASAEPSTSVHGVKTTAMLLIVVRYKVSCSNTSYEQSVLAVRHIGKTTKDELTDPRAYSTFHHAIKASFEIAAAESTNFNKQPS